MVRNHNDKDIERYVVMSKNHWTFQEMLEKREDLRHEKQRVFGNSYVVQWWDSPSKTIIAHLYIEQLPFVRLLGFNRFQMILYLREQEQLNSNKSGMLFPLF